MPERSPTRDPTASLVDLLDRVLASGVVAAGDVVLSVAGVDLVYLNLRALLASVQTVLADEGAAAEVERLGLTSPPRAGGIGDRGTGRPELASPERRWPRTGSAAPPRRRTSGLEALERFARRLEREAGGIVRRDPDPERVEQGLARLVLTLVDLLRRLMERQAIRRLEAGSLTDDQVDRLGRTFHLLERRMGELMDAFDLGEGDLGLDLGFDIHDLDDLDR